MVAAALVEHIGRGVEAVVLDDDTEPRRRLRQGALLLFRGSTGEPANAATFSRTWSTARAKAGLPPR